MEYHFEKYTLRHNRAKDLVSETHFSYKNARHTSHNISNNCFEIYDLPDIQKSVPDIL